VRANRDSETQQWAMVSSAMLECNIRAISMRLVLLLTSMLLPTALIADGVSVRYKEGVSHGFLVLRTPDGTPVADGESTQVAKGDHVTSHLRFKFKDGSSYDQTTVFSQRGTFRLMRDHVIQQGPSFKHQMETSIAAPKGEVTVRYTDDHNQEKLTTQHLERPPDLANGILFTLRRTFNRKLPRQPFPCGGHAQAAGRQPGDRSTWPETFLNW
jgi:hypothetical protein